MKTTISSGSTVIWKYVFPGVWIPFMGLGVIGAGFQGATQSGWIPYVIGWIIASSYLIWFARRLKFVSIDEEFIYVSQFRKQTKIPLGHIQRVTENFWARPKLIKLKLNPPSDLGTQIVFVPTSLVFAAFRKHPIVEEIKRAAQLGSNNSGKRR